MGWPEAFMYVGVAWAIAWSFINFVKLIEK